MRSGLCSAAGKSEKDRTCGVQLHCVRIEELGAGAAAGDIGIRRHEAISAPAWLQGKGRLSLTPLPEPLLGPGSANEYPHSARNVLEQALAPALCYTSSAVPTGVTSGSQFPVGICRKKRLERRSQIGE